VNRLDIGNMTGGETAKAVNRPAPYAARAAAKNLSGLV